MANTLYLVLGTNLGDRTANLTQAIRLIEEAIGTIEKRSSVYETEPWGVADQPNYWNQVLEITSSLSPHSVLETIHQIEKKLGRQRRIQWEARPIDIDILYAGDEIINEPDLIVPHPRIEQRRFVLVPLAEVAADHVHPVLKKTNWQLLQECADELIVRLVAD